jgi:hypothetical protein
MPIRNDSVLKCLSIDTLCIICTYLQYLFVYNVITNCTRTIANMEDVFFKTNNSYFRVSLFSERNT